MDLEEEEKALGRWPRRLLHIPTLTSYEWKPGNCYNGIKEPQYNAITYTWGRFRLKSGHKPNVTSVPIQIDGDGEQWSIPRIDPSHFTAEEFETTIRAPSLLYTNTSDTEPVDFLWLDIACIDQRETDPKSAAEIGRQAVIFHGARRVFVWLTTLHYTILEDIMTGIERGCIKNQTQHSTCHSNALDCIRILLSDPWFSSLWTLQEAFLKPEACLLSKDAALIRRSKILDPERPEIHKLPPYYRLTDVIYFLESWAKTNENVTVGKLQDIYKNIEVIISERGIRALHYGNELGMYEAALHRQASVPQDRVYGIQQIFGFRLGKSAIPAAPGENFSLRDLENQLGESLMLSRPVLSQLHVFTQVVPENSRWRFHSCSRVITNVFLRVIDTRDYDRYRTSQCSFWVDHSEPFLKPVCWAGIITDFSRLIKEWKCATEILYPAPQSGSLLGTLFPSFLAPKLFIRLDATNEVLNAPGVEHPPQSQEAAEWLVRQHPDHTIKVLLMGRWGPSLSLGLSGPVPFEDGTFGLILLSRGSGRWARLGVCQWDTADHQWETGSPQCMPKESSVESRDFLEGRSQEWAYEKGIFGFLD